jgi:multidrug efflux pump subunit AcrA (membrane-fusion protein)
LAVAYHRAVSLGPKVEVVEAVRREVVQAVVATGRIESPFRVDIGAQVVGTVTGCRSRRARRSLPGRR